MNRTYINECKLHLYGTQATRINLKPTLRYTGDWQLHTVGLGLCSRRF